MDQGLGVIHRHQGRSSLYAKTQLRTHQKIS